MNRCKYYADLNNNHDAAISDIDSQVDEYRTKIVIDHKCISDYIVIKQEGIVYNKDKIKVGTTGFEPATIGL